jgi:hypothetical protein
VAALLIAAWLVKQLAAIFIMAASGLPIRKGKSAKAQQPGADTVRLSLYARRFQTFPASPESGEVRTHDSLSSRPEPNVRLSR